MSAPAQYDPVDFVIITALEEERDAVLEKLPGYQQLPPSSADVRVYFVSHIPIIFADGSPGAYRVVVMPLLGMGRVQAATATADAIRRWRPRYVLLVGIAGGIAARDVHLGDILVSDEIVDYELQKLTPAGPEMRWEIYRADARLMGAVRNFRGDSWQALMTTDRPGNGAPTRHVGPIASGDKVIAFSEVLAQYRDAWPRLIGVEMEAAGVAAASFQAAESPGFFMVRGVSDLADEAKDAAPVTQWRRYACDIAASYAIALLQSGPVMQRELVISPDPSHVSSNPARMRIEAPMMEATLVYEEQKALVALLDKTPRLATAASRRAFLIQIGNDPNLAFEADNAHDYAVLLVYHLATRGDREALVRIVEAIAQELPGFQDDLEKLLAKLRPNPPHDLYGRRDRTQPPETRNSSLAQAKKAILKKRLANLLAEYEALNRQLDSNLNAAEQVRLRRQIEDLEQSIQGVESDLRQLDASK